jgi:hypothetical protein
MRTILIEIKNPKALDLLHELEELNILKIVKESLLNKKIKLSEKYRGVFSEEDTKKFDEYTKKSREQANNPLF